MSKEKKPSIVLGPKFLELLERFKTVELENVTIEAESLELKLPRTAIPLISAQVPTAVAPPTPPALPAEMLEEEFTPQTMQYSGRIVEVEIGATKKDGGTRSKTIVIGGEDVPPYHYFEKPIPHKPVIAFDVFDMAIPLPKAIKTHYEDVLEDPAAWAKRCVDRFGADMVTLHLVSTSPVYKDTSPKKAAKTVEEFLQQVKVPVILGGSGEILKDMKVLPEVAEVAEGERVVINSAVLDEDAYKPIGEAVKKHGHVVIALTPIEMSMARRLNTELLEIGLSRDQIVMDPTTAGVGYGIEFAFSVMERIRLAGLKGDELLQMPMSSGTTNAWAAREAWMKAPELGPRRLRGPLWEVTTGLALLLTGVDLFMMMHPAAARTLKEVVDDLFSEVRAKPDKIAEWVTLKI